MQKRKLTAEQVLEIRALGQTAMKRVDIARQFGISPQLVSTVLRYDYENRPDLNRHRRKNPEDIMTWEALARRYTKMYPDDPMTGAEFKAVHDLALKKIARWFTIQGLTEDGLLGS